jgi:hypothetical protein
MRGRGMLRSCRGLAALEARRRTRAAHWPVAGGRPAAGRVRDGGSAAPAGALGCGAAARMNISQVPVPAQSQVAASGSVQIATTSPWPPWAMWETHSGCGASVQTQVPCHSVQSGS